MEGLLFTVRRRKVHRFLFVLIGTLLLLSATASTVHYLTRPDPTQALPLVRLFRLVDEANIPTFFGTAIHLGCALVLGALAKLKKQQSDPFHRHWRVLSVVFFLFALDETAAIHELSIIPLRKALGAGGIFYYPWIIIAILLAAGFVAFYIPFLKRLPRKSRVLFVLAGAVFAGGSLAGEMITGYAMSTHFSHWRAVNAVFSTLEEFCEMAGSAMFLCALLSYLREQVSAVEIRIE